METTTTQTVTKGARFLSQKERTALIRKAVKAAGIKASVTSATGSMCYWTNVRIDLGVEHPAHDWRTHIVSDCAHCSERLALRRRVEALILAAYPDLDDRSDVQADYSNFIFSVEVR